MSAPGHPMPLAEVRETIKAAVHQARREWVCTHGVKGQGVDDAITDAVLAALAPTPPAAPVGEREAIRAEIINTPETADFMAGVPLEAAHQRERWGADHDAGKSPFDWFWLVGYLAQKAADAAVRGDATKAQHHTISTAAALANWHAALTGVHTDMRPGIGPGNGGEKPGSAYDLASKADAALSGSAPPEAGREAV